MCGGEREGAIPHKGGWSSTLDLSRSPTSVKDLSSSQSSADETYFNQIG